MKAKKLRKLGLKLKNKATGITTGDISLKAGKSVAGRGR